MKKIVLALALGTLVSTGAVAEQWYMYATYPKHMQFVNLDDIKCHGSRCITWTGTINIDRTKPYDCRLFKVEIDCENDKLRGMSFANFLKGNLVDSYKGTAVGDWEHAVYGTTNVPLIKAVCNPNSREEVRRYDFPDLPLVTPAIQKALRSMEERRAAK